MATKTKQKPTVPLTCRKCGSRRVKVTRATQMLRRTFRRDSGQKAHLHASCECPKCHNRWWSAHETALHEAERLNQRFREVKRATGADDNGTPSRDGIDFVIVDSTPAPSAR